MAEQWTVKPGPELGAGELYELLKLRAEVFVVEQDCPYQDLDDQDLADTIYHVQGFTAAGAPVAAYLRVMYNGADPAQARIGRVVVRQSARSTGMGRRLMRRALEVVAELKPRFGTTSVMLHGQAHLERWYGEFGFKATSDTFMEDGIPHLEMVKHL